jgi:hypothetical protein
MEKQLLLVLVCWYFFRSSRFSQPQSVLKDVECKTVPWDFDGKIPKKSLTIPSRSSWSASSLLCVSDTDVLTI